MARLKCLCAGRSHALLLLVLGATLSQSSSRTNDPEIRTATSARAPSQLRWERRAQRCAGHSSCPEGSFCESVFYQCSPCSRCQYDGDSVDFKCPLSRCPNTPIQSGVDVFSPMLRSISVTPNQVRVLGSQSRTYVTISLAVADDVSTFKMAELMYQSVSHGSSILTYVVDSSDTAPAAAPGSDMRRPQGWTTQEWQGSFWFQSSDEAGPWTLTRVVLRDHAANYRKYSNFDLFSLGLQHNSTIDVVSSTYVPCSAEDAWSKCTMSGGKCQPPPAGAMETGSSCVCNKPYLVSNKLMCLWDDGSKVLDFSNSSFWHGSSKGESPSDVGLTWNGELDDESSDTYDAKGPVPPDIEEEATQGWTSREDTTDAPPSKVWASTMTARSILSILMPCMAVMLCVHACRRIRYLRSLRRIHRGEGRILGGGVSYNSSLAGATPASSAANMPNTRQSGWMSTLLWRHTRQVGIRHELNHTRDQELAAQGLRAQFDNTGRVIALIALTPRSGEAASFQSTQSWRLRGGEEGYELATFRHEPGAFAQNARFAQLLAQPPAALQPATMPAHLLPGAVDSQDTDKMQLEDIGEGDECCVCFAARKSARLNPCGHKDLCQGCAQFLLSRNNQCPMCRSPIASVS